MLLAALFAFIQAIQHPIYFKYGYTKAKFISLAPFAVIMAGFVAFSTIAKGSDAVNQTIVIIGSANTGWLIICTAIMLGLIMLASYRLSLSFYKKREF